MQDPLKQGLKLGKTGMGKSNAALIRMQDPLKQGLKPPVYAFSKRESVEFECKIH